MAFAVNNRPRPRRASLTASALESSSKLLGPMPTSTSLSLSTASTAASSIKSSVAGLKEGPTAPSTRLLSGTGRASTGRMEDAKSTSASNPTGTSAGSLRFAPDARPTRDSFSKAPTRRTGQTATSLGGFGPIRSHQPSLLEGQTSLRDVTNFARSTSSHPFQKSSARTMRVPGSIVGPGRVPRKNDSLLNPASEYLEDILDRMMQDEGTSVLPANYLNRQVEVTPKMRGILIDWLVDVHLRFSLRSSTLFLSVNLLDRYLARQPVKRRRLQLLGVVATLVATKFEEVNTPPAEDFVYLTRQAYTVQDIFDLECQLLATLDFRVLTPTAPQFFEYFWRVYQGTAAQLELAQYILELTLLEASMVQYEPSRVAAAAILLSCDIGHFPCNWTRAVAEFVRHPLSTLQAPMTTMNSLVLTAEDSELKAITRKFQSLRSNDARRSSLPGASPSPAGN